MTVKQIHQAWLEVSQEPSLVDFRLGDMARDDQDRH